ncbi:O-antigen ligase family protein [Macellibacteroides fermentans]|uniref:O-antigen ligase-related domain-containing protein n=1 Tax=Macellibacteroides fermentans TaxID=879969 RepID=A0A8E1ZYP3_9PORP|nr:O-antigen ligase family protein [Macellibacteroides fermentans]NYI50809.1 hypothetical protein [Macellibacteroides fermentans]
MKAKLIISNIAFIVALFFMIGGGIYSIPGFILIAAYLILLTFFFTKYVKRSFLNKHSALLYLFLFYVLLTSGFDINTCISLFTTFLACILLPVKQEIIGNNAKYVKIEKLFFFITIGIMMYYCYKSLLLLNENPMALRLLISEEKDDTIVVGGGYALPYSMSLLCPFLLYGSQRIGEKLYKCAIYIVIAAGTLLVLRSLYTTALMIIFFGYLLVAMKKISAKNRALVLLFGVIVLFSFIQLLPHIANYFLNQDSNVVGRRLTEINNIINSTSGGDDDGDFTSRIKLTMSSIMTFLDNPIFGVGPSVHYDYFEMEKIGIGSHAQWFDIFAIYGIFALLLVSFLINAAKKISNNNYSLILFIILGFLNPVFSFTIVFTAFYIAPLLNFLWPANKHYDE